MFDRQNLLSVAVPSITVVTLMVTIMLSALSIASPVAQQSQRPQQQPALPPAIPPGFQYIRNLGPDENFVELTLNQVDKIRVPLPNGGSAGRVSLVDNPALKAARGPPDESRGTGTFLKRLWQKVTDNRNAGADGGVEQQATKDSQGRPLYHLKRGQITARSGRHEARCIFIADGVYPAISETEAQDETNRGSRWQRAHLSERRPNQSQYFSPIFDAWVAEVLCVTVQLDRLKILVDPIPPILPVDDSDNGEDGSASRRPVVELMYQGHPSANEDEKFDYALTKLSPQNNAVVQVNKATMMYPYYDRFSSTLNCRAIVYNSFYFTSLVQGPKISPLIDFLPNRGNDPGAAVFAFYCDNRMATSNYDESGFRQSWNADWINAAGN